MTRESLETRERNQNSRRPAGRYDRRHLVPFSEYDVNYDDAHRWSFFSEVAHMLSAKR